MREPSRQPADEGEPASGSISNTTGARELTTINLDEPGIWIIATKSGAQVLVAVVLNPESGEPIVTATRYAASGNGSYLNGCPMTLDAGTAPMVGKRWRTTVLRVQMRDADGTIQSGHRDQTAYVSTPISRIIRLEIEAVSRMAAHGLQVKQSATF